MTICLVVILLFILPPIGPNGSHEQFDYTRLLYINKGKRIFAADEASNMEEIDSLKIFFKSL